MSWVNPVPEYAKLAEITDNPKIKTINIMRKSLPSNFISNPPYHQLIKILINITN